MRCEHCNEEIKDAFDDCPHCGEPGADTDKLDRINRFKWWFIGIVVFCLVMMIWLPRHLF